MIKTLIVDTYPIRYAASENQGVWIESTHQLAVTPGQEKACYVESDGDGNELHVTIVNHAGRRMLMTTCEVVGRNYDQRKNMHFFATTLDEAKAYGERWIEWAKTFEFSPDGVEPYERSVI